MKKVMIRSLITAAVIEIAGLLINLFSFKSNGRLIFAKEYSGGECMEWRGFGLYLLKLYPMSSGENPVPSTSHLSFDPISCLITLLIGFVISFVVFMIIHKLMNKSNA